MFTHLRKKRHKTGKRLSEHAEASGSAPHTVADVLVRLVGSGRLR